MRNKKKSHFASDLDAALPKVKRRPRGRPFPKGHSYGLAQRFQKGKSGNPHGRPKSAEISKALRKLLASEVNLPKIGRTFAEQIVTKWVALGLHGNAAAIAAIADRAEGRPAVAISVDGSGDNLNVLIAAMNQTYFANHGQPLPEGDADGNGTDVGQTVETEAV